MTGSENCHSRLWVVSTHPIFLCDRRQPAKSEHSREEIDPCKKGEPQFTFFLIAYTFRRGILAHVRCPMRIGQPEGINNRIKVMKRMAWLS